MTDLQRQLAWSAESRASMCLGTNKLRYPSQLVAEIALASCRVKRDCGVRGRMEEDRYQCRVCDGWHLTSEDRAA